MYYAKFCESNVMQGFSRIFESTQEAYFYFRVSFRNDHVFIMYIHCIVKSIVFTNGCCIDGISGAVEIPTTLLVAPGSSCNFFNNLVTAVCAVTTTFPTILGLWGMFSYSSVERIHGFYSHITDNVIHQSYCVSQYIS